MLHTWGECTRQVPGHLSCTDLGRTQKAGPTESVFLCGEPENLNLSGLDLESAYNLGPTSDSSWQSNLEPEQCRLGKHTHHEGATPSVAETLRALPTHASDICLQCSSLPTARLTK